MKWNFVSILGMVLAGSIAFAADNAPDCIANGQELPVINQQVLQWKRQTPNQYKNRGHIAGTLTKVYPDKTGHVHIQVTIGDGQRDTIEVIYNTKFGRVNDGNLRVGAQVEACGDYITSNKKAGHYQPSPDGAILHWVHMSTSPRHDSGYMMIDGVLYGMSSQNGGGSDDGDGIWEADFDSILPAM